MTKGDTTSDRCKRVEDMTVDDPECNKMNYSKHCRKMKRILKRCESSGADMANHKANMSRCCTPCPGRGGRKREMHLFPLAIVAGVPLVAALVVLAIHSLTRKRRMNSRSIASSTSDANSAKSTKSSSTASGVASPPNSTKSLSTSTNAPSVPQSVTTG